MSFSDKDFLYYNISIILANDFKEFPLNERQKILRRPLICILISLIAGIVAGSYFSFPANGILITASLTLLLLLISLRRKWFVACLILTVCFTFLLGFFNIQKQNFFSKDHHRILNYTDQGKITLEGIIIESPVAYTDRNVLFVKCYRLTKDGSYISASGNIRLTIPKNMNFQYGDFIRFHSSLKTIHNFNNPGCFNYKRFMALQGIYVSGFIHDTSEVILLRKNTASSVKMKLEKFRRYLTAIIQNNSFSPEKEIIEAMTLGNQNEIPADVRDNFNKTGTSHILSISGLHIGMVGATFFLLCFFLLKSSEYLMLRFNIVKLAASISFIIVLVYAIIAGMGIPVMRATIMAFIFLIAILSGKQNDLYTTLAMAGLVILVISPEALFDISFQLSFVSVWAIIFIVPRFSIALPEKISVIPYWIQSILLYVYLTVVVSISATIGTLPLIIYYFYRVSLVTVIANIIAVPLLGTLTLAVSMFFILFSFSTSISGFFVQVASFFTQISITIINKLAALPFSSLSVTKPNMIEITVFYVTIFLMMRYIDEKRKLDNDSVLHRLTVIKYLLIAAALFFAADISYLTFRDKFSSELKVTIIDVGQGNSSLVQFAGGTNMLIDGGGFAKSSFDVGKGVVAPFICYQRIKNIESVVLSHPHPDHLMGLIYILNNFNVRNVWKTNLPVSQDFFPDWERSLKMNHINLSLLSNKSAGKVFNGVKVKVLWPDDDYLKDIRNFSYDAENDSSLVLKITYGNVSFLFPGDISSDIEKKLIKAGADLKSDVLVVPHHGSNKSSSIDFIKTVGCRYAVVSSGKSNVFKHPHPDVIEKYKKTGAEIFRTDQHGAITFTTDGNNLDADRFIKDN